MNERYKGTRWEDRDWREPERVVEVYAVDYYSPNGFAMVRVVAAPNKPSTVGRRSRLRLSTLRRRYREVASTEGEQK